MSKVRIKMKLLSLMFYIVSILFILFSKHSETLFLGESQYCYNYGFPFRVFITDFNNNLLHIFGINIIFNLIALLPLISPMLLCTLNQKFKKFNNILIFIFCLYVAVVASLQWSHKKYIYSFTLIMYGGWSAWFIFLCFYHIRKYKK